jgi:hypothetical protein
MRRSKEITLKKPYEQKRISNYFSANQGNIQDLHKAYMDNDIGNMREILVNNSDSGFIGKIYSVYDAEVKEELVKTILRENRHMLDPERTKDFDKKFKPKYQVSDRVMRAKQKKFKQRKQIKQKQKSGKVYKRGVPQRFKPKEIKFLKLNKELKAKELVERFNKLFSPRTKSSILTKRSRLKTKGLR